jgi:hypothetical protein
LPSAGRAEIPPGPFIAVPRESFLAALRRERVYTDELLVKVLGGDGEKIYTDEHGWERMKRIDKIHFGTGAFSIYPHFLSVFIIFHLRSSV